MKNLHKSAWAEVRTEALRNNLAVIRSKLPAGTAVCAVLKADAYGHGMKGLYRFLSANRLADMAAVGKMKELMTLTALSESGGLPLLLLGPTESDELETCLREGTVKPDRTVFSVYSMRQFDELEALAEKLSLWLTVHIRVDGWDSGMGLSYEEFLRNEDRLLSARGLHVRGLYSHLYTSYSEDLEGIRGELERFDAFLCRIRPEHRAQLTVHILNSALVFLFPNMPMTWPGQARPCTACQALTAAGCGRSCGSAPMSSMCVRSVMRRRSAMSPIWTNRTTAAGGLPASCWAIGTARSC